MTAFGAAMIETVNGTPQTCDLADGGIIACRDYVALRAEERALLDRIAPLTAGPVLDIGCGIGRHLAYLRRKALPDLLLLGAEICDRMRGHCSRTIPAPARFDADWRALVSGHRLGLVLLMGNGLGALGDEAAARRGLAYLADALRPGGRLLVETGNPFAPHGYTTRRFSLSWGGQVDRFPWGHAAQAWIENELVPRGLTVTIHASSAPPGRGWFIAEAVRA